MLYVFRPHYGRQATQGSLAAHRRAPCVLLATVGRRGRAGRGARAGSGLHVSSPRLDSADTRSAPGRSARTAALLSRLTRERMQHKSFMAPHLRRLQTRTHTDTRSRAHALAYTRAHTQRQIYVDAWRSMATARHTHLQRATQRTNRRRHATLVVHHIRRPSLPTRRTP